MKKELIVVDLDAAEGDFVYDECGGDLRRAIGARVPPASRTLPIIPLAVAAIALLGFGFSFGVNTAKMEPAVAGESAEVTQAKGLYDRIVDARMLNERSPLTGHTLMFELVRRAPIEEVVAAVAKGGDPNIPAYAYHGAPGEGAWDREKDGQTALCHLLKERKLGRVTELLNAVPEIDVYKANHHGATAGTIIQNLIQKGSLNPRQLLLAKELASRIGI